MTKFEKSQPNHVFVMAGRHAFMLGVHYTDNPYKEQPYHMLWEKGFRAEQRKINNHYKRGK